MVRGYTIAGSVAVRKVGAPTVRQHQHTPDTRRALDREKRLYSALGVSTSTGRLRPPLRCW